MIYLIGHFRPVKVGHQYTATRDAGSFPSQPALSLPNLTGVVKDFITREISNFKWRATVDKCIISGVSLWHNSDKLIDRLNYFSTLHIKLFLNTIAISNTVSRKADWHIGSFCDTSTSPEILMKVRESNCIHERATQLYSKSHEEETCSLDSWCFEPSKPKRTSFSKPPHFNKMTQNMQNSFYRIMAAWQGKEQKKAKPVRQKS